MYVDSPCPFGRVNSHYILAVVLACMLFPGVYNSDESSRKTYIVRYTNGNVTIPVTVVLDYRKQAEYVINMNSRSPTKSVTFYDFEQKSIAYKDMSNMECFIGRLSFETIEEENQRLKDVQNPVDIKPVVLNLDSRRSSLTPTEVRNIAGQKIAMFCRKMATWLLQETNRRSRRQIDQRIEKRYKHYGRESHEFVRSGHEIYEVSYPRNNYGVHKRRRENLIHMDSLYHPAEEVGRERLIPSASIYKQPGEGTKFPEKIPREPIGHVVPASIPLYKPIRNASIHTQHSYPLRNRNTIDIGGQSSHPLRGNSPLVAEAPKQHSLPSFPEIYGFHDRRNQTLIKETQSQHFPDTRPKEAEVVQPYTRPLRVAQHNAVRSHPLLPHFEYVHQLRSGSHNSKEIVSPPSASTSELNKGRRRHLPVAKSEELRSENDNHEFAAFLSPPLNPNRSNASFDEDANGNVIHSKNNIYRESESESNQSVTTRRKHDLDINNVPAVEDFLQPYTQPNDITTTQMSVIPPRKIPEKPRNIEFSVKNDRSDLPEEDIVIFPVPSTDNETRLLPQHQSNQSVPSNTVQEGHPPQKKRPQNVLELFTPDEIVIDIGKIPVPPNNSNINRFPGRRANATHFNPRSNETKHHQGKKQQTGRRKTPISPKNYSVHRPGVHRKRLYGTTQQSKTRMVLPPGISVYPRHPQAPYAELAPPNAKRTMTDLTNQLTPVHHQRHQRRKLRKNLGCCKRSQDRATSVNQCCASGIRRGQASCCRSKYSNHRPLSLFKGTPKAQGKPDEKVGNVEKDMCDMKRMCRTLYQSTKAVKVCKIDDVPGC